MEKRTLEWVILNYYKTCKACNKKMIVHAYRAPIKGKQEIAYCHCGNKNCEKYGVETPPIEYKRRTDNVD
jgi:hypothetical protein